MKDIMTEIKLIRYDDWHRELYVTKLGTYVVKVDNDFYSKVNNDPEGEPCSKLKKDCLKVVQEFSNDNNNES